MHRAPAIVHSLADLFLRPPGSITNKMMNLDGSRKNAGQHEWRFFVEMATSPERLAMLYNILPVAAREAGIGIDRLPDFLHIEGVLDFDLLGQDELSGSTFDTVIEIRAAKKRAELLVAGEGETVRMAEQAVRLIKPWAASDDTERLDLHNGVAGCPTHDAAFDTGLITVNGGRRVRRAPSLKRSAAADAEVGRYFGDALAPILIVPEGVDGPGHSYLEWHHEHVYQGVLAS